MAGNRNRRKTDPKAPVNERGGTAPSDKASAKAPDRKRAGQSKEVAVDAGRVAVNADTNWVLYKMGWTGTVDEFIDMMKASQGQIPGLERFRTSGGEEFSVHLEGFDAARHTARNAKLFEAVAEINDKWKRTGGRSLINVSAGG